MISDTRAYYRSKNTRAPCMHLVSHAVALNRSLLYLCIHSKQLPLFPDFYFFYNFMLIHIQKSIYPMDLYEVQMKCDNTPKTIQAYL